MTDFTLGVNYWPRGKAMYWWSNFDAGEVRDEFALIAELGLTLVRIFLLWDDFQPAPDVVANDRLVDLCTVCDLANDHRLKLDITFFVGHMSGPNWAPGWLLNGGRPRHVQQVVSGGRVVQRGYRNPYTDPTALEAEALLLRTVVGALKDHPAVGVWNLGNEPDLFAWPPNAAAGRAWTRRMTQAIHEIDPRHPVTCGMHVDSLVRDNGLRVDQVFAETDFATMHAYPMYAGWARGPLDPDFVPYTCALTAAPGEASRMWRWMAYGKPRQQFMASEDELANYYAEVLPRLVEVGVTGALAWCFADYAPELWDKPPCAESRHERFFGLVRSDGTLKPQPHTERLYQRYLSQAEPPLS